MFTEKLECIDYTVSKTPFKIVACSSCGFQFTNPRPSEKEIISYYKSEDYISHSNTSKGLINKIYQLANQFTLNQKYNLISKNREVKRLLDYGCGAADFIGYLSKKGINVVGLEPDEDARILGKSNHDVDIQSIEKLQNFEEERFDTITLWHVMEHIHKLKETLKLLCNCLENNGYVYIAVPNPDSHDAAHYGKYWAAYDVPRHLYHFTKKDVLQLAKENGLTFVESLPMYLDSFYVSMLSEKYKTGKVKLIYAFFVGLKSNLLASKKDNTYSSQIYVFRKPKKQLL